ncbi:MAG: hypothetical protein K8R53_10475 [Bacteroidales bacterium]|nr:hypothetical protein [Bacteroidales bacterium]
MKKLILIVLVLGISGFSYAQEENKPEEFRTIFGKGEITHGGYGGLSIYYSQIDKKDAMLVGARGAWLINHRLGIGIGGHGFANDLSFQLDDTEDSYCLVGG